MPRIPVAFALLLLPAASWAQQFSPKDSTLKVGQKVSIVVDAPCTAAGCGAEFVDGRVAALNADMVAVESEGRRLEFGAADVRRVETYGDPVWNGMAYGFVVTFGAAYVAASIDCQGGGVLCSQGFVLAASAVCGSAGAAIGAIADAVIRGRNVIFQRDARASIAPIIDRGAGGVRVSVRF